MSLAPAVDLVELPVSGRRFTVGRPVRLGDVDAAARMRFDAIARFLQDVASDDAADAGAEGAYGWLVRRTLVHTIGTPKLGEMLELTTFCSGYGRSWAERRTSIRGDRGNQVETVSLWVAIDPETSRPVALDHRFHDVWGATAGGRKVGPRLQLGRPSADAVRRARWPIRVVDIDPYRHANNAAQWAAMEEVLGLGADRRGVAEIEFVAPIDPTREVELVAERSADESVLAGWLVDADDAEGATVRTALRFTPGITP